MTLEPFAPILVTEHARRRAWERIRRDDVDSIVGEIRLAILEDRYMTTPPGWAHAEHPGRRGHAFVYTDALTHAWVVVVDHGRIVVKTVVTSNEMAVSGTTPRVGLVRR